ncbi:MAG: hypothetical protein JNM58_19610 [Xanthomonadaceae bacterium]|nr:hypothetical protein [Xanthomonadaceae bacterium]
MLKIELRQLFRSNGLIDDFVLFGKPEDYVAFSAHVAEATTSEKPVVLRSDSNVIIEISLDEGMPELFTSLQNARDEYFSMDAWNARDILRMMGSSEVLCELSSFLFELSTRGNGYSYLSEFSTSMRCSAESPSWRLHVIDP